MSFVHAPFLWLLLPLAVYLIKRNRKRTFQESLRWIALAFLIVAVARPVIKEAPLSATRFSLKVIALLALLNINGEAEELLKKKQWGENYLRSETFTSTMQNKGYFNGYFDAYYLHQAYQNYEHQDYNSTLKILSNIDVPSLESQLTLAHTYYKLEQYKEAKNILKNIKTTQPKIKQQLLYELGNCEAKLAYYEKAKNY